MKFVLASASPRRKELLAELITTFEICPSNADENVASYSSPEDLVLQLAALKAQEVALRPEHEGKIVIGSDTVVAFDGEVLGKPKDEADAFRMLKMLSGKKHAVYTGVCFARKQGEDFYQETRAEKTDVYFVELSDDWIHAYIAGGSPMDKAGAYGIQDGGLVEKIEGSYTNVVGFPLELVQEMLEKIRGGQHD
ncbi:MAG: septum formation protein Maf [Clostridiales bacterium]|nr:septum formation protein Maf [Clostridiales bacterium]